MSNHDPEAAGSGILPSQWIRSAIDNGVILSKSLIAESQVQPNSLDVRIGDRGHRVGWSFLPGRQHSVEEKLSRFQWYDFPLPDEGVVLERNQVYLFRLCERLTLPPHVSARANPKSTTGRLDVFSRLIVDGGMAFDEVPKGYVGSLYLEVVPKSFAIRVRQGDSLAQLRFQVGDPGLSDDETSQLIDTHDLIFDSTLKPLRSRELKVSGGVFLSVRLSAPDQTVGFRAYRNTKPIDLRAIGGAAIRQYWQRLYSRPRTEPVILEPDEFYVFASCELISLPPEYCAEMVPFDASSGELRTHYAGFFDSGFGYSKAGPPGSNAGAVVLEVRSRDVPFVIEHGHPLFRLMLMRNTSVPDMLYGSDVGSNYQAQRLRLSKQFTATDDQVPEWQQELRFDAS